MIRNIIKTKFSKIDFIDSLIIYNLEFKDNYIYIVGDTVNSSIAFIKYKYLKKDNALYIFPEYKLTDEKHSNGKFEISIECSIENTDTIYIKDENFNKQKMIWNK